MIKFKMGGVFTLVCGFIIPYVSTQPTAVNVILQLAFYGIGITSIIVSGEDE